MENVIPSHSLLASRIGLQDCSCPVCGEEMENLFHIFKNCQPVKILAFSSQWGLSIDQLKAENMEELMNLYLCPPVKGTDGKHFFSVFLSTLFI